MENQDELDVTPKDADKDVQALPQVDPESATPEEVAELVKTNQTLFAQKKHWRDQAIDPATGKKWREIASAQTPNSQDNKAPAAPVDDEIKTDIAELKLEKEKRQFAYSNKLSPEETDAVYAQAKGSGQKPDEVLQTPFVKNAIEAMRREQRTEDARPGSSSKAPMVGGKTMLELKPEERAKNWKKFTGAQ